MGEIPHKSVLGGRDFIKPLAPYLHVLHCVKQGEMEKFRSLLVKNAKVFTFDKNMALVQRLKHTVIKFGLKKINISYSKIALRDIQTKLGLESVEETEQIVAKAIRDGVIEARINHDEMFVQSLSFVDQYASNDPQQMLHKRVEFCMQLRNDAVRALTYPSEDKKDYGDFGDFDSDADGEKDAI